MTEVEEVEDLEITRIIGFDGNPRNGLQVHPNGKFIVYPLGMKVVIQHWKKKSQTFLTGHSNAISAIAISKNGNYIMSGQINHMGFKASVILWDFATRKEILRHEVHKVRVESVGFSIDSRYMISLGGRDDGMIVVWDIEKNETVGGTPASKGTAGDAIVLHHMNVRWQCFISGGDTNLRVWKLDTEKKRASGIDVTLGLVKRKIECIVVDEKDIHAFCGTTTGDIVKVALNYDHDRDIIEPVINPVLVGCYAKMFAKKKMLEMSDVDLWCQGVTALAIALTEIEDRLLVGAGDGTVELVKERETIITPDPMAKTKTPTTPQFTTLKSANVRARVTSLQIRGGEALAGTAMCEIYTINLETFTVLLQVTCHTNAIYDVVFPYLYPGVFATCGKDDIRVWDTVSGLELLRITVPNFTCATITFTYDGKAIISGWNDGEIRAFTPQKGRLIYSILNAHNRGVTALAITTDGTRIVSGGMEGQVRVWDITPTVQKLIGILKEHKGSVTGINMSSTNTEAVSSSADGTCIIWNIVRMTRNQIIFANTQFMSAFYHPSSVQLVTCGTDHKIGYWEVLDGSMLRELEGSTSSAVNSVHISRDGNYMVSGGNDLYVKLWKYQDGLSTHYGVGHAANITAVKFSPDCKFILSVSADGGIFYWKCPYPLPEDFDDNVTEVCSTRSTCSSRQSQWNKANKSSRGKTPQDVEENINNTSPQLPESAPEPGNEDKVQTNAETNVDEKMGTGSARPVQPCTCPRAKTNGSQSGSKSSTPSTKNSGGKSTKSTPKSSASGNSHPSRKGNSQECKCPIERRRPK